MMASLYEPLFRHVLFPAYESGLRRRKTLAYLREYERQQWLDPEQIDALQWRKLQALLRHCWDHVPYYRETWSALGITSPEDIRDRAHFARLPVLDKPTIRANFDRPFSIDAVARAAGMSASALHQHFKAVTAMSPLQYQKQIRLQEARRLMLSEARDAQAAGFQVGYESPSQFSREYARLFGAPPARDAARLRAHGPLPAV